MFCFEQSKNLHPIHNSLSPVFTLFLLPQLHKVCVKWFVHLLKLTAVTQSMAPTKVTDKDRVWAKDISPAVRGSIHGPVDEMLIRDE